MKSGTTTLYADLDTHPHVYFPAKKEPANLLHDRVLCAAGRAEYARIFAGAGADQVCGEASTSYTMLPVWREVPTRALKVLGAGVKLIYVVREPVARLISHHHHAVAQESCATDINRAVRKDPRLIGLSRYATQITPWLKAFGPNSLRVVRFETLIKRRRENAAELCEFLGLEPRPDLVNPDVVRNKSEGMLVARGFWNTFHRSRVYRDLLRAHIPDGARELGKRLVLKRSPPRPAPPSTATVRYIQGCLRDEMRRLQQIVGADEPLWDDDAVLEKYRQKERLA